MREFKFSHSEVMAMPFRTFMAYNRLATVQHVNRKAREKFDSNVA